MPLIYRVMRELDGKPEVGETSSRLGARVGPPPADIEVDQDGFVYPGTGGVSVSPHWKDIPKTLLPKRLNPRSTKTNAFRCWKLGAGDFAAGPIAEGLVLRLDPDRPEKHGFVEPSEKMKVERYQQLLAATQDLWEDGET